MGDKEKNKCMFIIISAYYSSIELHSAVPQVTVPGEKLKEGGGKVWSYLINAFLNYSTDLP